ncbi:MAG: YfiR/HmsC family protein [Bacteroidales bacterium]
MKSIPLILMLILLIRISLVTAQQDEESIKASLIYYFISYVNWPNENEITKYKIGVLSKNELIFQELIKIAAVKQVKGKPFEITNLKNIGNINNIHILVTGIDYNERLSEIYDSVTNKGILLISDNSREQLFSMINFKSEPNSTQIEYEANRRNLLNNGFTLRNELLLYGGSYVDIKELITEAEERLSSVLNNIEILEEEISLTENQLSLKNKTIEDLYKAIGSYQEELNIKNLQFREVSQQISEKQELLQLKNKELSDQKQQQKKIIAEIEDRKIELEEAVTNLQLLKKEISDQQKEIIKQDEILAKQDYKIKTQKRNIFLIALLLAVSVIMIISLFHSYAFKRRLNAKLSHSNTLLLENKTELEQTIKKLKETQAQLVQSEKMVSLGMITAGIAHEINNPINFINSGNELLPDIINSIKKKVDINDPETKETLGNLNLVYSSINKGVERTIQIISSLNNYVRSDNNVFSSHNIIESLNDAILILNNRHKDRIQIHENIGQIPLVECIPGKIYQVFINLLSNAIDAINDKGDIYISINKIDSKPEVEILITDTGGGIKEEHLPFVFDPFFSTKEVGKGTGLGLYIVYGIVKQHNGNIEVEPGNGKGAKFIINLPVFHSTGQPNSG